MADKDATRYRAATARLTSFALNRPDLMFAAKECARSICQLGRLARALDLECHWDQCLLTPTQHAAENIGYMIPAPIVDHWGPTVAGGTTSRPTA